MRVGFGYDSHRFVKGKKFVLGGKEIPHERGLLGHSDADVLLHAVCDAVLGAIGEEDIGSHFPDRDPAYRGISSLYLLIKVRDVADKKNYRVNNVDSTVVLERPELRGYIHEMAMNIAGALGITVDRVNIKATTNEGMGFVGRGEGIAAFAVVTMSEKQAGEDS
jgi:2-C-methyl-D-erythritol 2,4-cyclodiphosphate synthase